METEKELAKQILEKLKEMNTKLASIEDSLDKSDSKMDKLNGGASKSVESGVCVVMEQNHEISISGHHFY
ncbi:hypothetical protein SAMN04487919_13176 [Bacillus sp. ok061]|uniref:hypothetical protein n=1 Tax=Bacillus sp. ok061 TaxID=1761766 RepID=UPI00089F8072|nr:hypothetical protein [Bacillus sp. ok061]SEG81724.1 hypothetical protein SAMN04487919_13176 [Bacillus sp. ok061]